MKFGEMTVSLNSYYLRKLEATQRALEKLHREMGLHLCNRKCMDCKRGKQGCWTQRPIDWE